MPLLGGDHLSRGRGPVQLLNKVFFTLADFPVIAVSATLLFTQRGPDLASLVFGGDGGDLLLKEPLASVRPIQAYLILGGIILYFLKVFFWTWSYSHSNTVGVGSAIFVAGGYHLFVALSICLGAYHANRMPATWEVVVGSAAFLIALLHETMADRELAEFKRRNDKKGALLDYGYHAACRHPNYFFNTFPFPCVGLMSGSYAVFGLWLFMQIFWAHTQSGVALEGYMAENYGEAWEKYCELVPFFFPGLGDVVKILAFKCVNAAPKEDRKIA